MLSLGRLDLLTTFWKLLRGLWIASVSHSTSPLILIGKGAQIRNPRFVYIGSKVKIEDYAEVQGKSVKGIVLGNGVTIGRHAMIRPSGYYTGDLGEGLSLGDNSSVGAMSYIGCSGFISIGRNVMLGPCVNLIAENHIFDDPTVPMKEQGVRRRGIVIEDDCWLGTHVTVLDGVTVGQGSVVAAGAVVTNDVPPFSIVGGIPARLIRRR